MMIFLFVAEHRPIKELLAAVDAFKTAGYDTDCLQIGVAWEDFLKATPDGATVVVYSVDFFPSLMELLSTLAALQERGITLKSLQEPWLSQPVGQTTDFLVKLRELAVLLHTNRTRAGLEKARAEGKKLGRPVGYRKPK